MISHVVLFNTYSLAIWSSFWSLSFRFCDCVILFFALMLTTNLLEKRTLLSVIPAPPTVAMTNNSNNQSLIVTEAEKFIGLDPYQNDSDLLEKCEDLSWRYSADMTLGVFYLMVSIVGISENFYVFYQMRQTMKFRVNQVNISVSRWIASWILATDKY